jgi:predicted phage terminase large subunit-like protein
MTLTSAEADELAALERLQHGVETIEQFVARVTPKFAEIPWHLRQVYNLFELSRHQEVFATIAQPPRHGKTTSIATGLAYRVKYDPACLNFYATYGDRLSKATSRKIRRIARVAGVPISKEVANVQEWETPHGGGLKATSVGADVTGRGCNGGVVVADDILKGRKQAESKLVRDDAWDWLRDDLMSRLEPGASLIVNATRWHEDDPIGRLYADGLGLPWIHIVLPAVLGPDDKAADERTDADVRALWPEGGYDLERLAKIRLRSEHGWWSLYQQTPYPRGGGVFKRKYVQYLDGPIDTVRRVRRWDLAASTERDSAFTVGALCAFDGKRFVVEDVRRGQWSPHEVEQAILATARADGYGVPIWLPQDPGQAGKAQIAHLASLLHGYRVHFERETGSKESRFDPVASQAQAGNFFVVRGNWNAALIDELEAFPAGRTKDQADALSGAYSALLQFVASVPHGGFGGVVVA